MIETLKDEEIHNFAYEISEDSYDSYGSENEGYETFGEDYEPREEDFESDDGRITATKAFPW